MEKQNLYLLALAVLLLATVVSLAALNEVRLDVYVSVFTVAYFATSTVFNPRRSRIGIAMRERLVALRTPDVLGVVLFIIFALIVALRVAEILLR